jgi:TDG/mug DNA glycosylase family protein
MFSRRQISAGASSWNEAECGTAVPLRDRVRLPVTVLFVGINPGVRSEAIGHHFAGYSNRFWRLLFDSGLVPERLRAEDDGRLPQWGYGITNLIARCTPGIDSLRADEYAAGLETLRRKVRRWKPTVVAFVGITLFRAVESRMTSKSRQRPGKRNVRPGPKQRRFEDALVFVLPNPSGRNANFSYDEMRRSFAGLRRYLEKLPDRGRAASTR